MCHLHLIFHYKIDNLLILFTFMISLLCIFIFFSLLSFSFSFSTLFLFCVYVLYYLLFLQRSFQIRGCLSSFFFFSVLSLCLSYSVNLLHLSLISLIYKSVLLQINSFGCCVYISSPFDLMFGRACVYNSFPFHLLFVIS